MPRGIYNHYKIKGRIPWNKNKETPQNIRTKISEATKRAMSNVDKEKLSFWKGKKRSEETKQKMRGKTPWNKGKEYLAIRGENHPNWKGGTSKLRTNLLGTFEYRQWRSDVFTKDNFICQDCGKRGGDLEAHHIKELSLILKENGIKTLWDAKKCAELWDINNGITLCKECHKKTFNYH